MEVDDGFAVEIVTGGALDLMSVQGIGKCAHMLPAKRTMAPALGLRTRSMIAVALRVSCVTAT